MFEKVVYKISAILSGLAVMSIAENIVEVLYIYKFRTAN